MFQISDLAIVHFCKSRFTRTGGLTAFQIQRAVQLPSRRDTRRRGSQEWLRSASVFGWYELVQDTKETMDWWLCRVWFPHAMRGLFSNVYTMLSEDCVAWDRSFPKASCWHIPPAMPLKVENNNNNSNNNSNNNKKKTGSNTPTHAFKPS